MPPRVIAIDDDEMFLTATQALFSDRQIPLATSPMQSKKPTVNGFKKF